MTEHFADSLVFRPLKSEDFELLQRWLAAPHVHQWWRDPSDRSSVDSQYLPVVTGDDPTEVFLVEEFGRSFGLVQRYRLNDYPEWRRALCVVEIDNCAAGIDYLIGVEHLLGHGMGSRMITEFVARTWTEWKDISSIVVSVQQHNVRSWRALETAGFDRVWQGRIESDDPSDDGPEFVYLIQRD